MNAYLTPVWTVLLGVLVLHETVGPREIVGGLVVLGGIAIASSANRRRGAASCGTGLSPGVGFVWVLGEADGSMPSDRQRRSAAQAGGSASGNGSPIRPSFGFCSYVGNPRSIRRNLRITSGALRWPRGRPVPGRRPNPR